MIYNCMVFAFGALLMYRILPIIDTVGMVIANAWDRTNDSE